MKQSDENYSNFVLGKRVLMSFSRMIKLSELTTIKLNLNKTVKYLTKFYQLILSRIKNAG